MRGLSLWGDYVSLPLSINTLQTTNTYWQDAFCCSLSFYIHFSHNYSEPNVGCSPWDLSLPQNPSDSHQLPMISLTLVFTLMVQDPWKNVSRPGSVCWGAPEPPHGAVLHCGYLPCSCCPSLLAEADPCAVVGNKTRSFIAYCKSPDEKLAHSYLWHQSCLTPH